MTLRISSPKRKASAWPKDYEAIMIAFCAGYRTVIKGEKVDINPAALSAGLKKVVEHLESKA